MKKLTLCLSFILFALSACDLKISSTINISDLLSDTNKVVSADLMVEVMTCDNDKLQKVIAEVDSKNISAKYNKCYKDGMDSYALFSIPVMIVKNGDEAANKGIVYLSVDDNKVYIHSSDRINSLLQSENGEVKIKEITFNLVNDTDQDVKVNAQYVFVDEKPVVSKIINLEPYSKTNIQLSDVASRQIEVPNISFQIMEFK